MSLPRLCVDRPIAVCLLWGCVVLAGIWCWLQLPVAALPRYETPMIEVKARLAGASPSTMAASVATPMEKEFSGIQGLVSSASESVQGETTVLLEFAADRDIDGAASDVQAALFRVSRALPSDMTAPPDYKKVNPGDAPIIKLALWSPSLALSDLNAYIEDLVVPALSQVQGVAQVNPKGRKRYAVRIQLDPQRLSALDLSLQDVSEALNRATSNTAMGQLDNARQSLAVEVRGSLARAADFRRVPVATRDGRRILLEDVAAVADGVEENQDESRVNGRTSIVLDVKRQPGANVMAAVDEIRRLVPALQSQLPASVSIELMGDRSDSVRESIHDVNLTLLTTVVLVVLVIAMFLGDPRIVLVPSVAIPVSMLATFVVMAGLQLSLNNVSLMALTIAVGLVVDDAIVVVENIHRKRDAGLSLVDAAVQGTSEVGFTLLSISLSLAVVFVPILLMPDTIGLLFREFAIVVPVAVMASMLVALTLLPALTPWLGQTSRTQAVPHRPRVERWTSALLDRYDRSLALALRHRWPVIVAGLSSLALTIVLYTTSPKGFFPDEDTGQLSVSVKTDQAMSYQGRLTVAAGLQARLAEDPAVAVVVSQVNRKGMKFEIDLRDRAQRDPLDVLLPRLRGRIAGIPGVSTSINVVQNLKVGGSPSDSPYEYVMRAVGREAPFAWAERMQRELLRSEVFAHVESDMDGAGLQAEIVLDLDKMATLGIDMAAVRQTLSYAYGGREVASIYAPQATYKVLMELADDRRQDEADLTLVQVRSGDGGLVPLESFATVTRSAGPTRVSHRNQLPAVTLSFELAAGRSLSDAHAAILEAEARLDLPPTVFGTMGGQAALFERSSHAQVWLVLLAVFAIYVILGVLYESWLHPLVILVGVPSAAVGAFLALRVLGMELTFVAMVGVLLLVGVVKKNAILLVDFAIAARSAGAPAEQAIREACRQRFRPIVMTSLCTLVGALPLALGLGAGAELRQPMGVAVVGGLAISLLVTLYLTPVVYVLLDGMSARTDSRVPRGGLPAATT